MSDDQQIETIKTESGISKTMRVIVSSGTILIGVAILICIVAYVWLTVASPDLSGSWINCRPLTNLHSQEPTIDPIVVTSIDLIGEYTFSSEALNEQPIFALAPNMQYLAFLSPNTIEIWNIESGSRELQIQVDEEVVVSPAWSSDSKLIAFGVSGFQEPDTPGEIKTWSWPNSIEIWDVFSKEQILEIEAAEGSYDDFRFVGKLLFSPNRESLIAQSSDGYYLWDHATGELQCHFFVNDIFWDSRTEDMVLNLGWRVDEPPLISGQVVGRGIPTNSTRVWNSQKGDVVQHIDTEEDLFWDAIWSSNSRFVTLVSSGVAYGVSPDRLTVWSHPDGELHLELGEEYTFLDWAPDEQKILVKTETHFEIWDVIIGTRLVEQEASDIYAGYWSDTGETVAILFRDGAIQMWEVK